MSFIDMAISGIIGFILVIWPQSVFFSSIVTPDANKIRLIRGLGGVLLIVAAVYLGIKLVGA